MSADQHQRAIAYIAKIANPLGLIDDHFIDGAEIERLLNA